MIQKERSQDAAATPAAADGASSANGTEGSGDGKASSPAGGRKRDILDKVLDSLEPGEWGTAAVLQVSKVHQRCTSTLMVCAIDRNSDVGGGVVFYQGECSWVACLSTVSVHGQSRSSESSCRLRIVVGGVTGWPAVTPSNIRSRFISMIRSSACDYMYNRRVGIVRG